MKLSHKIITSVTALLPIALVSCQTSDSSVVLHHDYRQFVGEKDSFEHFLNNSAISQLLDLVYPNKDTQKQLINQARNINSQKYIEDLKYNLNFFNTINNRSSEFNTLRNSQPILFTKAKESYENLFKFNWLWLLYNLKSTVWIRGIVTNDQFKRLNEDYNNLLKDNALNESFYQPNSNEFKDIIIVKQNTTSGGNNPKFTKDNYRIFLLNKENYIFEFALEKTFNNSELVNANIEFSPWIKIYPNFVDNNKVKFPFADYVRIETNYRTSNSGTSVSLVERSVFEENQGGDNFSYTLIDFKK
ncbi:Uncharacterised protein [Mesomycoplasma conjunctivae]|uniref:Lipoprotein n=1 Tax=Mesomycoplasma conjunctivae (strain ATCC 25834 / NCTC 10147 / HRC/581) TaxID=572263 RepID=C5J5J4_MESCH|nr:aromatic motif membrane protein [Mesomycoplasma conjunctivae]CAT04717.1 HYPOTHETICAL PROTEIN MCJ_000390 [Mesomycoplasma conjunctivae]VEU65711.1 Uncharacterised protein [Mesomycoplasma conjunctivae]